MLQVRVSMSYGFRSFETHIPLAYLESAQGIVGAYHIDAAKAHKSESQHNCKHLKELEQFFIDAIDHLDPDHLEQAH